MKSKVGLGLMWTALLSGAASAQSLGDVAEKEKARRRTTVAPKPVRVIGNEELLRARGVALSVTGRPVDAATADKDDPQPRSSDDGAGTSQLSEREIKHYRDVWNRVWAEQMAAAEKQLELARDDAYQCRSAGHYFFVPLAVDCNGVGERLALAEFRLKEVRSNRYNWELLVSQPRRGPPR